MTTRTKPKPPDVCKLTCTIRGVAYTLRPIRPEADDVIRAWRLRKADGECYTVADTIDGAMCECADFIYRHEGKNMQGCKHIRSLRALNLIDPEGSDPADWPGWVDHTIFVTSR